MKPNETKTVLLLVARQIQNGIMHGFWWPGGSKHLARPRALISSRDSSPVPKTRILLSLRNFNEGDEIKNNQAYINRNE